MDEKSLEVDLLVFTFRDLYIGRADMYHIKLSLAKEFVFSGMKLSFGSIHLTVQELTNGTNNLQSGIITEKTKVTSTQNVIPKILSIVDCVSFQICENVYLPTDEFRDVGVC